jgi:hypothetical protein
VLGAVAGGAVTVGVTGRGAAAVVTGGEAVLAAAAGREGRGAALACEAVGRCRASSAGRVPTDATPGTPTGAGATPVAGVSARVGVVDVSRPDSRIAAAAASATTVRASRASRAGQPIRDVDAGDAEA